MAHNQEHIPIDVIRDRNFSIFESIVKFLKEKRSLSYHDIAVLLNRDDRTIWTVYNRARKKAPINKNTIAQ